MLKFILSITMEKFERILMKKFDLNRILMFMFVFLGVISLTINKFILAGVFFVVAFGIYQNGGAGKYEDKTLYEKETDASNLTIESLYEALKDMETPLGKCWVGKNKFYSGDVIIWGPNGFKDCITLGIENNKVYIRCTSRMDYFSYDDSEKWRFDDVIDTAELDVTPRTFSIFAGYKLITTVMVNDINNIVADLNMDVHRVPSELDLFSLYYYNSSDGNVFDMDGNLVLTTDLGSENMLVSLKDADGNEMIRIERTEEKDDYSIIVDDEEYGHITKVPSKNDRYTMVADGDEYDINSFQAVNRAKISVNYSITKGSEVKAYTAGSSKIIFGDHGTTHNAVICSMDDDYMLLYTAFQILILNIYRWLR